MICWKKSERNLEVLHCIFLSNSSFIFAGGDDDERGGEKKTKKKKKAFSSGSEEDDGEQRSAAKKALASSDDDNSDADAGGKAKTSKPSLKKKKTFVASSDDDDEKEEEDEEAAKPKKKAKKTVMDDSDDDEEEGGGKTTKIPAAAVPDDEDMPDTAADPEPDQDDQEEQRHTKRPRLSMNDSDDDWFLREFFSIFFLVDEMTPHRQITSFSHLSYANIFSWQNDDEINWIDVFLGGLLPTVHRKMFCLGQWPPVSSPSVLFSYQSCSFCAFLVPIVCRFLFPMKFLSWKNMLLFTHRDKIDVLLEDGDALERKEINPLSVFFFLFIGSETTK